jgi:uncharacterized membrane protein (DUF4010 family)
MLGTALITSAMLTKWLGARGLLLAAAVTGLADTHAAAVSAASVATAGQASVASATLAVLIGFSANTATKIAVACTLGDRRYALELVPGLLLMAVFAWAGELAFRALAGEGFL